MLTGFSDEKIISLLNTHTLWGKRACREIIRRKDDFMPLLINILDRAIDDPDPFMNGDDDTHIPAAMLLAQMREPQAYPRLVRLMDYDDKDIDFLWGEVLAEHYTQFLRDTYNGDASLLPGIIEKRSVAPFSRIMAVYSLGMYYFDGHISREEITGYFRRLIHEVYTGKPSKDDEIVLSSIADCIREQQLDELIADVKTIYDRNGIEQLLCGSYDKYTTEFSAPINLAKDRHIDDTIQTLQEWRWFEEKGLHKIPDFDDDDYYDYDDDDDDYDDEYDEFL